MVTKVIEEGCATCTGCKQRGLCEKLISSCVVTEDTCKIRLVKANPLSALSQLNLGIVSAVRNIKTPSEVLHFLDSSDMH